MIPKRTRYYSSRIFPLHVLIIPPHAISGYIFTNVMLTDSSTICFKSRELKMPTVYFARVSYKVARKLLRSKHLKEALVIVKGL